MVDNRATGGRINWFVLNTRASSEFKAAEKVQDLGYETFVPTEGRYRRRSRYARAKELVQYPLLPSYLLIASNDNVRWFDVLSLDPVLGVISSGDRPATVRPSVVNELKQRHVKHEFNAPDCQKFMRTGHEFAAGDECEIMAGPFRGHEVTVQTITGNAASVVLDLFSRKQAVKISLDLLSLKS
jgi:transcription antitermination factor NusG